MIEDYTFFPQIVFRSPIQNKDGFEEVNFEDNKKFSESLYIANPLLHNELSREKESYKKEKIQNTLHKYKIRLCNRCTPFGLFAGIGVANWGDFSSIQLVGSIERVTKLDMNILCELTSLVSNQVEIIPHLKFYFNNSAYEIAGQLRYVEVIYKNNNRSYQISAIDFNPYLKKLQIILRNGEYIDKIVSQLTDETVSKDEALKYVDELIQSQVLVSEIEPFVTGKDYLSELIEQLKIINLRANNLNLMVIINYLIDINLTLKKIDSNKINEISIYEKLKANLKKLNLPLNQNDIFQTDFSHNITFGKISNSIQSKLGQTIISLNKLFPNLENQNLKKFKEAFIKRYDQQGIPILELFDKDLGMNYSSGNFNGINPLIDDLKINQNFPLDSQLIWNKTQEFLFKKLIKAIKNQEYTVKINHEEFNFLNLEEKNYFADTFAVMFSVLDSVNNKIILKSFGGSSATNLLGRFGHVNNQINDILKEIAFIEQKNNPDKIIAEIIHLPQSRLGNVIFRPAFREFEIPYLTKSNANITKQIELKDIIVYVRNNKIILYHKLLKKEVIPKLGNAHNYSHNSLPIYEFLCDIQNQNIKNYTSFDWGSLSREFDFLPRVEIDSVIVFSATWHFKKKDFLNFISLDEDKLVDNMNKFKTSNNLPDKVLFIEGDNELLFDLTNKISLSVFINTVKNKEQITIKEYLFDNTHSLIKNKEGKPHTNECLCIVSKKNKIVESNLLNNHYLTNMKNLNKKRVYTIGSKWLYYKIYTGVKHTDNILTEIISDIILKLERRKLINQWFFIRYNDPEHHIRLRLKCNNVTNISKIIFLINKEFQPIISTKKITNLILDTYIQELERYGSKNMENTERIFHIESQAVISALPLFRGENGHELRWKWAIVCVDRLISDFGLDFFQKHKLMEYLTITFGNEFNYKRKSVKIQLDNKFRKNKNLLNELFEKEKIFDAENEYLNVILKERSLALKKISEQIIVLKNRNQLEIDLNHLLFSYIHMSLNRIFMGNFRLNEFVTYDLLFRYYTSKLAKDKKSKQQL